MRNINYPPLIVILPLVLLATTANALAPPSPAQLQRYEEEGILDEYIASARALGNHRVRPDLAAGLQRRLIHSALAADGVSGEYLETLLPPPPSGIHQGLRSKGTNKIFALLIEFPEYRGTESVRTLDAGLFGDGVAADAPYDSLRNFYRRSSYNQLEIQGNTLGYYRSPSPRASVPHTTEGRENLIKEALTYFDQQGHDFNQYDNDGDGSIDYFCVFWTGPTEDGPVFWWPSYIGGWSSSFVLDDKDFSTAAFSWQDVVNVRGNMTRFTPVAVIHETGHALGLPDLYDYDPSVGPDGGAGGLDVMDGIGDHNSFSKMLLGWITPAVAVNGSTYRLAPAGSSPSAVILWPAYSLSQPFTEFFMVQNRTRVGNDSAWTSLGDGLLIWHIDARLDVWGSFKYDNSYSDHKLVRLMEADGLEEIEASKFSNAADAGDFYRPGKTFEPTTFPNSDAYDKTHTGVAVTGIVRSGSDFLFKAGVNVYTKRRAVR